MYFATLSKANVLAFGPLASTGPPSRASTSANLQPASGLFLFRLGEVDDISPWRFVVAKGGEE